MKGAAHLREWPCVQRFDFIQFLSTGGFKCDECGEFFSTDYHLMTHIMAAHKVVSGVKTYACSICGQKLSSHSMRKKHEKEVHQIQPVHRIQPVYRIQPVHRIQPVEKIQPVDRIQPSEKVVECSICQKRYENKAGLERHMLRHYVKRTFQCLQCEASYYRRGDLMRHQKMHEDDDRMPRGGKPYSCYFCPKNFTLSKSRKEHEQVHTGEKNIQCGLCPRTFRSSGTYSVHRRRVHMENKKYKCPVCPSSYDSKAFFAIHLRLHDQWTSCMFRLILFSFLCPSFVIVDQGKTIHFTPCLFFALIILFFPWNRTLLRETPIWFR